MTEHDDPNLGVGHERWFREPSRREHWIAGALFVGFGIFFLLLFALQRGWWFRWVVMGLGIISILHGLRHMLDAMRKGKTNP